MKIDSKCPDISVKRKGGTDAEYIVKVNGEIIPLLQDNDGYWSRKIYISKKYKVVIKVDDDYMIQSRNEIVFWTEKVKPAHKKYFTPVVGWGTTTCKAFKKKYKIFYCVQKYIDGATPFHEHPKFRQSKGQEVWAEYDKMIRAAQSYGMTDCDSRQVKVNSKGAIKIHDYGLFGYDSYSERPVMKSNKIPFSASTAEKKIRQLEKAGG